LPATLPRIVHVITALPVGGAQTVLRQLVARQRELGCAMSVVSLADLGEVGARIRAEGTEVRALGMRPAMPDPLALARLVGWLRQLRPDAVQTWLYHGDLLGGLAARLAGVPRLYWNLRQSDLDPAGSRWLTMQVVRACARLSRRLPDLIVCCSEASREVHAAAGYDAARMRVIDNGVDIARYRPDPAAPVAVRAELGLAPGTPLVGLVARYHPQKDHAGFLAAAGAVARARPEVRFLLCGEAVDAGNAELAGLVARHGLQGQVHLLGIRGDVPRIDAALDLAVLSSSFGEGFPNVAVEAMAAGVPCVVTDVGDAARIVGETGWVVPRRDPAALGAAMLAALADPAERLRRGAAARERALARFDLTRMLAAYGRLYRGEAG